MIAERTLKKWRKEALNLNTNVVNSGSEFKSSRAIQTVELCKRILKMTQELLDLHLIKGK